MNRRALIWQLYPSYLIIVALAIVVLGWYFLASFAFFQTDRAREELGRSAQLLKAHLMAESIPLQSPQAEELCNQLGGRSDYRFTIILPDGRVTADSEHDPASMDNHADRPEVRTALKGEQGFSRRFSDTHRANQIYVALPVHGADGVVGVIRSSLLTAELDMALQKMRIRLYVFSLMLILATAAVTFLATRKITRPLAGIARHLASVGNGGSGKRIPHSGIHEIDVVAININNMAERLNDRIATVERQRDEQNALFACMAEGVIAVDNERRIIRMNAAARKLFQFGNGDPRGMMLSEVVRHSDLIELVDRTLDSNELIEADIELVATSTYLQGHGSILRGSDRERIGAIVVLNDMTNLYRLEVMRKDFVANVSHELKTPITSIRGFLDTVMDTPDAKKKDRDRFMHIISQQVQRLQSIVEDLLTFSNLEHEIGKGAVALRKTAIRPVLNNAIQICSDKAHSKNIDLKLVNDLKLDARINVQLLEQAVINLIDNAIKYSENGTTVEVWADRGDDKVVIAVKDEGMGIPARHLSRIFERFYCVDKSRSRQMGGTGLGLAIVKHIAIAHQGWVSVNSSPGLGSTFEIHIPD